MLCYCVAKLVDGIPCDPIACEINVSDCLLHDLGGGFRGYVVYRPWPGIDSCVIDSRSGAILSGTLSAIRNYIKKSKLQDHTGRQATALRIRGEAREVDPGEFWPWIIQMLSREHA